MRRLVLLLAVMFLSAPSNVTAGNLSTKPLELPDFHGQPHQVNDFSKHSFLVVMFIGTECPLAKQYSTRLMEIEKEFGPKGFRFLGIDANVQDSLSEMGQLVKDLGITVPLLKDKEGKLADMLGATRTPEVFVLDRDGNIRYQGRIDDQYSFGLTAGYAKPRATHRELQDALTALAAGESVKIVKTEPAGCLIGRAPKAKSSTSVTYSNQVARIIQRRCIECHREGEAAPFAMTTYSEVVGWAPMMKEVVDQGRMPPWFADPKYGHFANDDRLTDEEKKDFQDWIDGGCPEGDAKDLPKPREFAEGWRIPEPDAVFEIDKTPFHVPAEGVVDYKYFTVDPGFKEDKWIQAAEALPGNRQVVHHIIVFATVPRGQGGGGGLLGGRIPVAGYAPGEQPRVYPKGVAVRLPAGSKLLFQMHYTPCGTPQDDISRVGFKFADPATVKKASAGGAAINFTFRIPAGEGNVPVVSNHQFKDDALLTMLFPHMHLRGKAFKFEAVYPNGDREVLLDVPQYDFNWQLRYDLKEPKFIPKGTELVCTAHFDNSKENPANPDPSKDVRWGPQTWEEMMIGFFATIPTDKDPDPLRLKRNTKDIDTERSSEGAQ